MTYRIVLLLQFVLVMHVSGQEYMKKYEALDSIIRQHVIYSGKKPVPNFLLYAENQKTGFKANIGRGIVGRTSDPIDSSFQFKIASITKTFVAVVTLQLYEEGKIELYEPVGKYISHLDFLRFQKFHVIDNRSFSEEITIEQLLRHNSGIADIFTDAEVRFNLSVLVHKKRTYTPEKVVDRYYKYKLNKKALFQPGKGYHYSDMNYMLLGFMIEEVTGLGLHEAIRERILDPLEMHDTYFEYFEEPQGVKKQIDAYFNRLNLTKKVNTSYEWAGGGLISNTQDLATFIQAVFQEKLFRERETMEMMTNLDFNKQFDREAGMGIFQYEVKDKNYFGHGGFYGSLMIYDPEHQITFVANIGQSFAPFNERLLVESLLEIIEE
jgi:D-alanyl-D-alanine carboxypeptidase